MIKIFRASGIYFRFKSFVFVRSLISRFRMSFPTNLSIFFFVKKLFSVPEALSKRMRFFKSKGSV